MGINGNSGEGYLEALDENGHWGGVCETNFDKFAGQVICQMLGYPMVDLVDDNYHSYGGNFVLELLKRKVQGLEKSSCTGQETSIFDCNLSEDFPICSSGKVAYVKCMDIQMYEQMYGEEACLFDGGDKSSNYNDFC